MSSTYNDKRISYLQFSKVQIYSPSNIRIFVSRVNLFNLLQIILNYKICNLSFLQRLKLNSPLVLRNDFHCESVPDGSRSGNTGITRNHRSYCLLFKVRIARGSCGFRNTWTEHYLGVSLIQEIAGPSSPILSRVRGEMSFQGWNNRVECDRENIGRCSREFG